MTIKSARFLGRKKDYDILSNRMNKAYWRIEARTTTDHINCIGEGRDSIKRDKNVKKTCHYSILGCMAYCLRATSNYLTSINAENPIEIAKSEILTGATSANEAAKLFDDKSTKNAGRKVQKRSGSTNLPVKIPQKHREIFGQVFFHPIIENGQEGKDS